jgi:hypothetical protein
MTFRPADDDFILLAGSEGKEDDLMKCRPARKGDLARIAVEGIAVFSICLIIVLKMP